VRIPIAVKNQLDQLSHAEAAKDVQRAVKPQINALRSRARFFVSPGLERKVLDLAGE